MNMPGFTAANSFYTDERLEPKLMVNSSADSMPQDAITPQLLHPPPVDCESLVCVQQNGYLICYCG
jgi:hypothetical protein